MLKIIICDEDKECSLKMKQFINYHMFDKADVQIDCLSNGQELLKQLNGTAECYVNLIFLNINMPKLNGLSIARILRHNHVEAEIVFTSTQSEYVFQGYKVHAYDYLLKPIKEKQLEEVLDRYGEEYLQNKKHYLFVSRNTKKERIPLRFVNYFLSDKRKVKAILPGAYECVEFYMKMSDLEEELKECDFVRCHQSYLVNINRILSWDGTNLLLAGNERIPVSRKYRNVIADILNRTVFENI